MKEALIHKIIRSRRRSVALQITSEAALIIRAPHKVSVRMIEDLVQEKLPWILSKQRQMREKIRSRLEKDAMGSEGLLYLGEMGPIAAAEKGREALRAWYKEQAREIIAERLGRFVGAGMRYGTVRISGAKTRWGSCGPDGSLNFSWRLVMAPLSVIDYVVAHELAHLEVRDHSPKFWGKVSQLMPDYRESKRWLRQNQHLLEV